MNIDSVDQRRSGAVSDLPYVSVIVPCRNEEQFIVPCLESILANDYPPERMEILVVDGASDDGTRSQIVSFCRDHATVRLLDNPRRTTPAALNIAIKESRGSVIVRMDAHNAYPADYISVLVDWLRKSRADNVGGVCVTVPSRDTVMARAVAVALSHPFGVGNSYFRIGVAEPRWVDTVPFGCYRREIFEKIGLFDEQLVRNQDDEFNMRLVRSGGRILLVPQVISRYYGRDSLGKLWRMYYQYGYFKALVLRKHRALTTWRQVAPPLLVLSLLTSVLTAVSLPSLRFFALSIPVGYLIADAVLSFAELRRHGLLCSFALLAVFPVLHISYGTGTLKGLVDFVLLRRDRRQQIHEIPLTR